MVKLVNINEFSFNVFVFFYQETERKRSVIFVLENEVSFSSFFSLNIFQNDTFVFTCCEKTKKNHCFLRKEK